LILKSEENFDAFKEKLKLTKLHEDVRINYDDHEKFANEMDSTLLLKKSKLDNSINDLEVKLEQLEKS
jgi:hypothetical protein